MHTGTGQSYLIEVLHVVLSQRQSGEGGREAVGNTE